MCWDFSKNQGIFFSLIFMPKLLSRQRTVTLGTNSLFDNEKNEHSSKNITTLSIFTNSAK